MPGPPLKPFVHWAIYRQYKIRYTKRSLSLVTGRLTTETGEITFEYDPIARVVSLPDEEIAINEYGWEIDPDERNRQ